MTWRDTHSRMWSVIWSNVLDIATPHGVAHSLHRVVTTEAHLGGVTRIGALRALEEGQNRGGVVVEHLRARELAVADLVEREDRGVQALAGGADGALVVEDGDFVVVRGDDAGIHSALVERGLQR